MATPDAAEVIPGLYMGAAPTRRAARTLARAGVSCAVDLRTESTGPSLWPESVQIFSYPLTEFEAPPMVALRLISNGVAKLVEGGDIVYVHCRAGVQRAPMVACAVLLQMGWSLADSYRLIQSRRPLAAFSEAQLGPLKALEVDLQQHPRAL